MVAVDLVTDALQICWPSSPWNALPGPGWVKCRYVLDHVWTAQALPSRRIRTLTCSRAGVCPCGNSRKFVVEKYRYVTCYSQWLICSGFEGHQHHSCIPTHLFLRITSIRLQHQPLVSPQHQLIYIAEWG